MMSDCKLCQVGMPLRKYLDGSMRHFDGLSSWHPCSDVAPPPANDELEREAIAFLDRKYSYQPFRASLAPILADFAAQIAVRAALEEHKLLLKFANEGKKKVAVDFVAYIIERSVQIEEHGAELQKAVRGQ